jgi:GNAT superfamily N-acetyltransferase
VYAIDRARPEDVRQLTEIERKACDLFLLFPDTAALPLLLTPPRDLEEARRRGMLWVGREPTGSPVGFALAERLGAELHLEELDVLPEHGRRGLGGSLVRAVCDYADAQGYPSVTLCTFRDIPWNAPFYERLGFDVLGPEELTPALEARMEDEARHGLPLSQRVAMRWRAGRKTP